VKEDIVPQYGMLVYSTAPADPLTFTSEHLALLGDYPAQAKALKGKVLGGTYFPKQRGFAFGPSTSAMTVQGDTVSEGTLASGMVASAFYVVAAPSLEVAVQIAKLHPAARDGAVEVHPLFVPAGPTQDDYAEQPT
jgi:hypothetical protein